MALLISGAVAVFIGIATIKWKLHKGLLRYIIKSIP